MRNTNDAGKPATKFQESILETAEWCHSQHRDISADDIAKHYNVTIPTARKRMQSISHHKDTSTAFNSKPYTIRVYDIHGRHAHLMFDFAQRVMAGLQPKFA